MHVRHQLEWVEDDVGGAVAKRLLEPIDDLSPIVGREPLAGVGGPCDVATELFALGGFTDGGGVRMVRKIMQQPALDRYRGEEIQPGAGVASDGEIDGCVRRNVESAYHPSCTCKMGDADDPAAVVDSQSRVLGLDRLRVVDSSIFPAITNGNLNAPTIMVAERAADMILGRSLLRPDDGLELYPQGGTNGEVASAMRQQ